METLNRGLKGEGDEREVKEDGGMREGTRERDE